MTFLSCRSVGGTFSFLGDIGGFSVSPIWCVFLCQVVFAPEESVNIFNEVISEEEGEGQSDSDTDSEEESPRRSRGPSSLNNVRT